MAGSNQGREPTAAVVGMTEPREMRHEIKAGTLANFAGKPFVITSITHKQVDTKVTITIEGFIDQEEA